MKKSLLVLFYFSVSALFAQQSPNSGLNYKKSTDDLLLPNSPKLSLNMDFFKLEGFKQNTNSLSELLRESYNQRVKPTDHMPIFVPEGKFFLEIYDVDEDLDYKLRIFEFKKLKYFLKSVG